MRQAGICRRRFLAGGAAASAGALSPATVAEADTVEDSAVDGMKIKKATARTFDVVVVNAGLAGNRAASEFLAEL